jgi:fructokinase
LSAGRAVVVGESLVDIVALPDGRLTEHPGGSPANVAVALARLGRPTTLVTQYADDRHGALLDTHLRTEGVDPQVQAPASGRTSVARARLTSDGAATYEFDLAWDLAPWQPPKDAAVIHTGSLGAVLEPGTRGVAAIIDSLQGRATVTYDLNLRPGAMGDMAVVAERVQEMVARSDVVKASDEDLAHLHPGLTMVEAARHLFAQGPAAVVVTLGARGALCIAGDGEVEVPAPVVAVVDTIGAGDSFCAAMIDRLWDLDLLGREARHQLRGLGGRTWTRILEYAAAAAAITVTRQGGDPPRRSELAT